MPKRLHGSLGFKSSTLKAIPGHSILGAGWGPPETIDKSIKRHQAKMEAYEDSRTAKEQLYAYLKAWTRQTRNPTPAAMRAALLSFIAVRQDKKDEEAVALAKRFAKEKGIQL